MSHQSEITHYRKKKHREIYLLPIIISRTSRLSAVRSIGWWFSFRESLQLPIRCPSCMQTNTDSTTAKTMNTWYTYRHVLGFQWTYASKECRGCSGPTLDPHGWTGEPGRSWRWWCCGWPPASREEERREQQRTARPRTSDTCGAARGPTRGRVRPAFRPRACEGNPSFRSWSDVVIVSDRP